MENHPIFSSNLASYPDTPTELGCLGKDYLSWQQGGIQQQLCLDDVVGTSLVNCGGENQACLLVSAYPKQQVGLRGKKERRVLQEYYFTCADLKQRSQWQAAIDNTLVGKAINADLKQRHLQIIINPNSGQKKAAKIFEQVLPLLDRSNLSYTVRETCSAADTKEVVRDLDLAMVDGLVIVGGDGTIHDAIAGLMSRQDSDQAMKLPLGMIPGGTGNGLSKSLLESAGEDFEPLHAAFLIAKGRQQSFDLAQVTQGEREYYSFLSLAWGLISDADIESEKIKLIGSLRFDVYALILLTQLRTYKGKFSYLPHPGCQHFQSYSSPTDWQIIEDDFIFLWAMNTPWAAHDMNVTPYARLNDGAFDILIMRRGTSRLEILKALLRCGKGQHLNLPHMEYYKVSAFKLEPLTKEGILVVDGEQIDYSNIEMKVLSNSAVVNC